MKKFIYYALSLIIASSLQAQDQSRVNQAITTLEEYAAKLPQAIQKTIRCARGVESCTQAEITQARTIIGVVGAAFAVVSLSIAAGVTTKVKGWWPFRPSAPKPPVASKPPVSEQEVRFFDIFGGKKPASPEEEFSPEEQEFAQQHPLPVPSRPAPLAPSITMQDVNTAVNQLTRLEASQQDRQMALNRIEQAIIDGVITLRDKVPEKNFTFQDLINTYVNAWQLRSTYAR